MEYSWSFAAAKAPLSIYNAEPAYLGFSSRPRRSKSTSGAQHHGKDRKKQGSRVAGHSRASSCSPRSQSPNGADANAPSRELTFSAFVSAEPAQATETEAEAEGPDPPGAPSAATGRAEASAGSHEHRRRRSHHHWHHWHHSKQRREQRPESSTNDDRNKQLPATPRSIETPSEYSRPETSSGDPGSSRVKDLQRQAPQTPASPRRTFHQNTVATDSTNHSHHTGQHAAMSPDQSTSSKVSGPAAPPLPRAESISSTSGATAMSSRTIPSSEHLSSIAETPSSELPKPFVVRNGRTYLSDPSIPYPLPVDLSEIHRQSLRMLLLFQLFGGPVCSPAFSTRPPRRVLEVGCGSAFWSMICHRYFARQGHKDISFTGIDIAPVAPGAPGYADAISGVSDADTIEDDGRRNTSSAAVDGCPDKDMKWQFVQHDLRKFPWPLPDNDFDLVIVKDMSLVTHMSLLQRFMDEYIRVLRPGGTLEIWESDHTIRMLRPHVPELPLRRTKPAAVPHVQGARTPNDHRFDSDSDGSEDSEQDADEAVSNLGAYVITRNTPLSSPLNNFLVEYNGWVSRALEARGLSPMPCTVIGPLLLQESETLTNIMSRRLAVPLSEIRWEREGVGGVVTKDGKSYIETKGRGPVGPGGASLGGGAGGVTGGVGRSGASSSVGGQDAEQSLTTTQAALRKTALTTVVQQIHSLEWILRDVSGKSQDEWDGWLGKMMNDLVKEQGTSWGECLEIGAWWATKRA